MHKHTAEVGAHPTVLQQPLHMGSLNVKCVVQASAGCATIALSNFTDGTCQDTAPVLQQWLHSPEKDTAPLKKVKGDVAQHWLEMKASALQDLLAYQAAVNGGCLSSAADQRNAGNVRCFCTQQSNLVRVSWLQSSHFSNAQNRQIHTIFDTLYMHLLSCSKVQPVCCPWSL